MRMHKPATVLPLRIAQVPLPAYPVLGNVKPGGVLLSGKLASAVDALKLDTRDMPPSRFKSVRDDISRYSPIPVTRVALRQGDHAYVGIIDSNNEPFIFALSSQGMLVKRAPVDENAWLLFDQYMEAERSAALETRRRVAAAEQATLVIKADVRRPGSRGGTFYFDKHGKVRYGKQPVHDHHVHVELPAKHELEGDAAALHKHVRKQNPATVHEARKHIRSWIKNNYSASTKQVDQTTAHMLRYFHEEGALHLHPHEAQPTTQATKDVPHFFKKREALSRPILPTPFDTQGTRLIVNGSPVKLSADAEHACYAFAKRFLVNEGTVKGHAEFVRGFEKSLQAMGVPKGNYDYKNFVKRITTEPEKEKAPKSKEQPTPKTHPHLFIKQDGQFVRLSDVRTPAGNFYTGKGKRGTWARALREEDITMNVAKGGAPKGWKGKTIFDPTKDYYLTWRHPDTDEIGYVYPSRASAYQKKFEEASKLGLNIDRIRQGVVRDIESGGSNMQTRVAALCTYLIDKEHFRVGEESHAEDTGTFGIGSLRVEHVKVDGKHVIFDFPGKKDEPWRRVVDFSKMPEALHIIKECLAHKHKKDRVWEKLGGGWSVDSKGINEYLDGYSKDGVKFTAKMFRTFHANKYMKKMLDTVEQLAAHHGWDDATVKKLYKGFKVNDKTGKKLLDMAAPGGGTVRQALGLEENHGAKGKGKAIIGVLPTIATRLGHTVSSCRNSYIDPVLVTPFGAKHGWDERTLGEKKTRDDLPVFEKKFVAKPAKQPKAPVRKTSLSKALPYGHVAYARHSKTGKLVQVKGKVAKAVPIIQRPGVRGGHFHFNTKGKVVYERHITYNAPARSWRGFDDIAFRRVMDEHKHVETAHQKHVKRLAAEMKTLREKKRTAKPHRREAIQTKINKLRTKQMDHRAVVAAAREQRLRVSKQRTAAKKKYTASQRALTKKKQTETAKKRKRETIVPIGMGIGIGTHAIKEKPSKVKTSPVTSRVPAAREEEKEEAAPVKAPEPKVESAPPDDAAHRAAAASAAKWDPHTRTWLVNGKPMPTGNTWKPGSGRQVLFPKEKTHQEIEAEERQKRERFAESDKRARAKWAAERAEHEAKQREAELRATEERAQRDAEKQMQEERKPKKRGLLSRLFGRKDAEQLAASFVDSHNIFKVSYL